MAPEGLSCFVAFLWLRQISLRDACLARIAFEPETSQR